MIEFLVPFALIIAFFAGAQSGRMDGGGLPVTPEIVERLLCIALFVVATFYIAGFWSALSFLGIVGLAAGHGPYFLDRKMEGMGGDMPGIDFIVRLFFGKDWREQFDEKHVFTHAEVTHFETVIKPALLKRNLFGLFVGGLAVGLPSSIACFIVGDWGAGLAFMLTGPIKALSYFLPYKFGKVMEHTPHGEYLNGAARNVLALSLLLAAIYNLDDFAKP